MGPMPLVVDLLQSADEANASWRPLYPGVQVRMLYEQKGGPAAAFLRYDPGARVPRHRHQGYEHIYVLRGSQRDERGVYQAGAFVVNVPGTEHDVTSDEGCLVLVVWERAVAFLDG